MVAQSLALAKGGLRVVPLALLLAFCIHYPVRFAIEGKTYALLVLLVALAWWWRRAQLPGLRGIAASLAGLTHLYGLFLVLAAAIWDGLRSRRRLALASVMAALPALTWIGYASDYLFSSRSGSWIGSPDFALLEETLARGLGLWPLPKLAIFLLLIWGLSRWGGMAAPLAAPRCARFQRSDPFGIDGDRGGSGVIHQASGLQSLSRCPAAAHGARAGSDDQQAKLQQVWIQGCSCRASFAAFELVGPRFCGTESASVKWA